MTVFLDEINVDCSRSKAMPRSEGALTQSIRPGESRKVEEEEPRWDVSHFLPAGSDSAGSHTIRSPSPPACRWQITGLFLNPQLHEKPLTHGPPDLSPHRGRLLLNPLLVSASSHAACLGFNVVQ